MQRRFEAFVIGWIFSAYLFLVVTGKIGELASRKWKETPISYSDLVLCVRVSSSMLGVPGRITSSQRGFDVQDEVPTSVTIRPSALQFLQLH